MTQKKTHRSHAQLIGDYSYTRSNPSQNLYTQLKEKNAKRLYIVDSKEIPVEIINDARPDTQHVVWIHNNPNQPNVMLEPLSDELGAEMLLKRSKRLAYDKGLDDSPSMQIERAKQISRNVGGLPYWLSRIGQDIEEGQLLTQVIEKTHNEEVQKAYFASLEQLTHREL